MKNSMVVIVERKDFQNLFDVLSKLGYQISGPTLRDNAVIYDNISSVEDLPVGWTDHQEGGRYRLEQTNKKSLFAYVVGPHNWKKILYPAEHTFIQVKRNGLKLEITSAEKKPPKSALIGVRPCELQALVIYDKVLKDGPYPATSYLQRRQDLFIVAVNCVNPGGTCFCASMNTGPKATSGFDLALTEIINNERHYFVVETGSKLGADLLKEIPNKEAGTEEIQAADKALQKAAARMGRTLDTKGIHDLLYRHFDDPHWGEITKRCLTCGNCTMVCPTCFCVNVEDTTSLDGRQAERLRKWDSCFTVGFSYIHGGSIRATETSRYRQWMMHKLSYWQNQFGTLGCVGCGRCITWCPVGIDITEEAAYFRKNDK